MSSSPSQKRKRLMALKSSGAFTDIDEMINLASDKLYPILEMLVDSSNTCEHFITVQELDDVIIVTKLIDEVNKALKYAGFEINLVGPNYIFENYRSSVNAHGKIYVETILLIQLIDLYNILEDLSDTMDEFYESIGIHSFVQTESDFSTWSEEAADPNKIVLRLTKPLAKSSTSFGLLQTDFIVMPSMTNIKNNEDDNSPGLPQISESQKVPSTKKVKSTASLSQEATVEVTDIYGAKELVVRCICDLQEVTKYLSIERKDVATICSRVEVDNLPKSSIRKSDASAKSYKGEMTPQYDPNQSSNENECCCPDCFAQLGSKADLQECDDDKIIICIKGCNEDEGDVQIIIRQCPDCKKAEDISDVSGKADPSSGVSENQSIPSDKSPQPNKNISPTKPGLESTPTVKEDQINSEGKIYNEDQDKESMEDIKADKLPREIESTTLHNKDSEGSYVCSEESDEEKARKESLPLPRTPAPSVDEKEPTEFKPTNVEHQARVSCSRIRFFETTNLCLQTDDGQELVIALTVTPRDFVNTKLSLRDIFSDDEYTQQEQITGKDDSPVRERQRIKPEDQKLMITPEKYSKSDSVYEPSSFFVEDRVIPLERTKICSSMDFDVTTVESKLRSKGYQHKNPKIVVQLQELGINNLLRACRPAKCCRKAVLNEKMKKCLPYPPSLRSLPLDESDVNIINQSLQMSLQKVKNSTNLNKDFQNNVDYSANFMQIVMYFFVETELHQNKSGVQQISMKRKLSYYINLENDLKIKPKSKYDVLYFDVDQKSNNLPQEVKPTPARDHQNNNQLENIMETISNPYNWVKQKYNKYEERPMLTGNTIVQQNNSFRTLNSLKSVTHQPENNQTQIHIESEMVNPLQRKRKTERHSSRIPVYRKNLQPKLPVLENSFDIEQVEQEMYGLSLESLPKKDDVSSKEDNFLRGLESKSCSSSKSKYSTEEKSSPQYILNRKKEQRSFSAKKKKKSFYLSRSKSDTSIKTLKNICTHIGTNTKLKGLPEVITNTYYKKQSDKSFRSTITNYIKEQDSSKIILNYFSKMLYDMILKETSEEKTFKNMIQNKTSQENCSSTNKSFYELYKRLSNKNNVRVNNMNIEHLVKSTHYNLKAKQSQSCILITSNKSKNNVGIFKNLALQTSILLSDSKQCQTSSSLLAYYINSQTKSDEVNVQKKRIFKKIYNTEALTGIPNSCDEIENFIVVFKSDHSLNPNFSDKDLLSSSSNPSETSFGNANEQTISNSLLKLKETLEKYESVKNEITHGSLQKSDINPIEYFVYQMCACNNFNKKPSVMERIVNKTKGLFSSLEQDICSKYKNQRDFFSMSPTDRKQLCHRCGCLISKCGGNATLDKNPTNPCQCPPENKPKKTVNQPCCNFNAASNSAKITTASKSSLKSIKTCFRKSISNMISRSRDKAMGPCSCDKETLITKNVELICIPEGVNVVACKKKNTSTETTQDSATQKCECSKCENFAEDGTCCCSHCLGCLDKSFDAKPDNNNVGILCQCIEQTQDNIAKQDNGVTIPDPTSSTIKITDEEVKSVDDKKDIKSPNSINTTTDTISNNKVDSDVPRTSIEKAPDIENVTPVNKEPSSPSSSDSQQQNEEAVNISNKDADGNNTNKDADGNNTNKDADNNNTNKDADGNNTNNDTTSYYVLTSPPNIFTQFGFGNRNPFDQYLLNFPHINMLRVDNSQTFPSD